MCRFGKPEIDLFASRLNHKLEKKNVSFRPDPNAMAADAFSISWTKQYVYIFCNFQHTQYGFTKDCERRGESINSSPLWKNSKLMATTGSSDFGFSHKTSPNMQNIVSAKHLRKNSPTTETEAGGISRIREVLQGRGIQGESADLIIQAWRQLTKKQ